MVLLPSRRQKRWGGRLPLLERQQLSREQHQLEDEMRASVEPWALQAGFAPTTDDGRFIGPMNVYLHRPGLARPYLDWLVAEQDHSSLPPTVRETVILAVTVAWRCDYAMYAHRHLARQAGLDDSAIDAITAGNPSAALSGPELAAASFASELSTHRRVTAATYRGAQEAFGDDGLVDLIALVGMYLTACAFLNAFEVPAPADPPAGDEPEWDGGCRPPDS